MRSPSTVKVVAIQGEGTPNVFLQLDAANAYGTPVRSSITCDMAASGSQWRVVGAVVDGESVDPYALLAADAQAGMDAIR